MTEDEQKHFAVLVAFAAYCDLSLSLGRIREASEWAVSKIERLTQEKRNLQNEVDAMTGEAILRGYRIRDLENREDDDESE